MPRVEPMRPTGPRARFLRQQDLLFLGDGACSTVDSLAPATFDLRTVNGRA
jgi:hypothetical protein